MAAHKLKSKSRQGSDALNLDFIEENDNLYAIYSHEDSDSGGFSTLQKHKYKSKSKYSKSKQTKKAKHKKSYPVDIDMTKRNCSDIFCIQNTCILDIENVNQTNHIAICTCEYEDNDIIERGNLEANVYHSTNEFAVREGLESRFCLIKQKDLPNQDITATSFKEKICKRTENDQDQLGHSMIKNKKAYIKKRYPGSKKDEITKATVEEENTELVEEKQMMDLELQIVDDSDVCPICYDILVQPHKIVPCDHIFCKMCLYQVNRHMIHSASQLCPLCRTCIKTCEHEKILDATLQKKYPNLYCERRAEISTLTKKGDSLPKLRGPPALNPEYVRRNRLPPYDLQNTIQRIIYFSGLFLLVCFFIVVGIMHFGQSLTHSIVKTVFGSDRGRPQPHQQAQQANPNGVFPRQNHNGVLVRILHTVVKKIKRIFGFQQRRQQQQPERQPGMIRNAWRHRGNDLRRRADDNF